MDTNKKQKVYQPEKNCLEGLNSDGKKFAKSQIFLFEGYGKDIPYMSIRDSALAYQRVIEKNREKKKKANKKQIVPAVNFTEFCRKANLGQIKYALMFYEEKFVAEKVLEYFDNWELKYDDSQYRKGKILINKHSTEKWKTTITINDDAEFMFADNTNCWQYIPKTMSEFISDCLRYEDIDLLLSEQGIIKIYKK